MSVRIDVGSTFRWMILFVLCPRRPTLQPCSASRRYIEHWRRKQDHETIFVENYLRHGRVNDNFVCKLLMWSYYRQCKHRHKGGCLFMDVYVWPHKCTFFWCQFVKNSYTLPKFLLVIKKFPTSWDYHLLRQKFNHLWTAEVCNADPLITENIQRNRDIPPSPAS